MSQAAPRTRGEMELMEHLAELRTRLLYSFAAVAVGAMLSYLFSEQVFALLSAPYFRSFPDNDLIGTGPAEAFLLKIKVSLFAGAILASPLVFFQVWRFVEPGLLEQERRLVVPFVAATSLLFGGGVWFCYEAVLPFAFSFFAEQYGSIGVTPAIRLSEHLSLMMKTLLGFGLVFEMPVLFYFLGRLGVVDSAMLIRSTRHAVVAVFVIAAILTPPDVVSQLLMAGPLLILYGVSIGVVRMTERDIDATNADAATAGEEDGR